MKSEGYCSLKVSHKGHHLHCNVVKTAISMITIPLTPYQFVHLQCQPPLSDLLCLHRELLIMVRSHRV